jgi:molecular chaperone GrpE
MDNKQLATQEISMEVPQELFQEQLDECAQNKKLAEDRLTQLQYLQADFDNLKKQCAKEKIECIKFATEDLIKALLAVLDSFNKALEVDNSEGLKQIYQQFFTILEKNGLKKIEALGKKFDPYYHEAISQEKNPQPEGTIIEELQCGYLLNSKVIRNSKVKISGGDKHG